MKNKLVDLNDHLFLELERLNANNLSQEKLDKEIKRANAIASISSQIVANAKVELETVKVCVEYGSIKDMKQLPTMLQYDKDKIN